jgi:hypothetical protein
MENQTNILWRYIDLYKLKDLIEKDALYFCRLDKLPDIREGHRSMPSKARDHQLLNLMQIPDISITIDEIEERAKTYNFVNCWHRSPCQSQEMWQNYPKAEVVIKTTVDSLKNSLKFESTIDYFKRTYPPRKSVNEVLKEIQFGNVTYINSDKDFSNPAFTLSCFHKEKNEFEYENEFRVCVQAWSWDTDDEGKPKPLEYVYIPVKLDLLIHEIFMKPSSSNKKSNEVDSILKTKGLPMRVVN